MRSTGSAIQLKKIDSTLITLITLAVYRTVNIPVNGSIYNQLEESG